MSPNPTPNPAQLACLKMKSSPQSLALTGFIRQSQLIPTIVPVSAATLWRWVKTGQFVAPVKLGKNITAWKCEDVRNWLAAKEAK